MVQHRAPLQYNNARLIWCFTTLSGPLLKQRKHAGYNATLFKLTELVEKSSLSHLIVFGDDKIGFTFKNCNCPHLKEKKLQSLSRENPVTKNEQYSHTLGILKVRHHIGSSKNLGWSNSACQLCQKRENPFLKEFIKKADKGIPPMK